MSVVRLSRCRGRQGQLWHTRLSLIHLGLMIRFPGFGVVVGKLGLGGLFPWLGRPIRVRLRVLQVRRLCGRVHPFPRFVRSVHLCLPQRKIFARMRTFCYWLGFHLVVLIPVCSMSSKGFGMVCVVRAGYLCGCTVLFRPLVGIDIELAELGQLVAFPDGARCPYLRGSVIFP